ncbi:hypothetical protein BJV78DRAFT_1152202 [Lactifluus subvellereus]|nr:hypothetical protein BJV78DRAFT_1152202 [Lactifluus subvellereus]
MATQYGWPLYLPQYIQFPPTAGMPVSHPALLYPYPDHSRARVRRHSFNGSSVAAPAAAPWPTGPAPYYPPGWTVPARQLHPLLDAAIASNHLHLDFTAHLEFKRRSQPGSHHFMTLSAHELGQPATNPQMTRVRVVCDTIPQWYADMYVNGTTLTPHRPHRAALPYLTLEDVIWVVYGSLHRKISHEDWSRLTRTQQIDVERAFAHRVKASGSTFGRQQQAEGAKLVDLLLKHTWFKGFVWLEPKSGVETLKLIVGW